MGIRFQQSIREESHVLDVGQAYQHLDIIDVLWDYGY